MGLDVSHDCWRGAYSAFSRWRHGLALAAGYDIVPGGIRDGQYVHEAVAGIDWDAYTMENYDGHWPKGPPGEDPLMILIVHSDCGGVIEVPYLKPLAGRIEGLISKLPTEEAGGHIGNWAAKTQEFVNGLRLAADLGEEVEFG